MPQSYYDDSDGEGPDAMTRQAAASNSAEADKTPAGDEDQPTFLIPKSALMGQEVKVGDIKKARVLRIMDDQIEAVCVYDDEEKEAEAPVEEEAVPPVGDGNPVSLMD